MAGIHPVGYIVFKSSIADATILHVRWIKWVTVLQDVSEKNVDVPLDDMITN